MVFTVDGIEWDIDAEVRRNADITASDISGLMMDGSYFNDVLGVYLSYDIVIKTPDWDQGKYAALYEQLSNPVDGHTFILPYNLTTVEIAARVESVSDEFVCLRSGRRFWKDTRVTIIANYPTKALSLGEMVVAGRAPLPSIADPSEGDSYTYTSGGWVPAVSYDDADDIYY